MTAGISLGILPAPGDFLVDGPRAEQVHGWILTPCRNHDQSTAPFYIYKHYPLPVLSTDNYKINMGYIIREFLDLML